MYITFLFEFPAGTITNTKQNSMASDRTIGKAKDKETL
jgi:hypothetical protein